MWHTTGRETRGVYHIILPLEIEKRVANATVVSSISCQTQTWNTWNQHSVRFTLGELGPMGPNVAMSDLHMQAMHDELAALAAISAVSAEREQRIKKNAVLQSEVKRCLSRVRSDNGIVFENFVASFRSLHTICSTEGLKMLQTCFLRWWKAQFLDIGVKPQLELGISLKLETFFQARYLEAFQRLPPDLVMCLADWCSQVGERYVCCGAEWASDGLCSLRVSTALETLDSSACCILFSPDFVVSERLFPWKIPQGCGTISSKIPMMRRRSGALSLHVSDCVIRSVCPRAVMVTATDRTYRHILSLSLSIFRTFEEVFAQTPLKTLIDFDFWGQLVWSPWFEPTNTLRAALDTWGARPATWNSERCVRPRRTLPWGRLVPASSRGTSRCGTKSRETHGDPWDSASWQKSRKECEWTEWP